MPGKNAAKNVTGSRGAWSAISNGSYAVLDERTLSEAELKEIAEQIKSSDSFGTLFHLIGEIPVRGRTFDWNVGGLLQHFDADVALSALQHVDDAASLHESVGLAWVFGQYRNRQQAIISHLYSVVAEAKSSEAWWQAAFSLEKLHADDAVNLLKRSLKASELNTASYYLGHLEDKRSLIGILLVTDEEALQAVYAKVRETFLGKPSQDALVNCCWLIGRLHLFDDQIAAKLISLMTSEVYSVKYYAFLALQNNATEGLRAPLEAALGGDVLSRRLAARALRVVCSDRSLIALEAALVSEKEPGVVSEITKTIYRIKNPPHRERQTVKRKTSILENGTMYDENADPCIYDLFAQAQDPEGLCFDLILNSLGKKPRVNPVVASMRTGVALRKMLASMPFEGTLLGFDRSPRMCAYVKEKVMHEQKFAKKVRVVTGTFSEAVRREGVTSDLIVRSFGLPGSIPGAMAVLAELKAVHETLSENGEYWTIGWDELFNDGLNAMAFKYLPDGIQARNFEEWREERARKGMSRDATGLTWFKRGLLVPLQYGSLQDAATAMGHLFGRDASQYVIRNVKTEWSMSVGITRDTKKSLKRVIAELEAQMGE